MGISYVGVGALRQAASSVSPTYPATPAAGQLLVLQVVSGHPNDPLPATPSGWTRVVSLSGGAGTFGTGTGPRRLTWYVRVATGDDPIPTTSIPSGATGSLIMGRIHALARSAGTGWLWSAALGQDISSGTSFSASSSDTVTFRPGDFLLLGHGDNSPTAQASAEAVIAAGVTFSSVQEQADNQTATGYGAHMTTSTCSVTVGAASASPTVTATLTVAATGVGGVLRLREDIPKGVMTVTQQTVFPPRNLIAVTEMRAGDVASATVYRQLGSQLRPLRGVTDVDVTGQDALVRTDGEQPFGVPVVYVARLVDSLGDESTITSKPVVSTVDSDVVSDAVRGVGARVFIENWPEFKRTRDATSFNVGGRYVTVGRPRSTAQSTVTVSTDSTGDGDALQAVLEGLTEGVLLIRKQVFHPRVDGYLALLNDGERPNWQTEYTEWDLEVAQAEAWPAGLEAVGYTLADLANQYSTLQDLADDFAGQSLLDIALRDFGG